MRRLAAAVAALLVGLSGCATVPPGPTPTEHPPQAPPQTGRERAEQQKAKRYEGFLRREVLPLLAADIAHIKRKHFVGAVSELGLHHVHVRYPRIAGDTRAAYIAAPGHWHHLHYHGVENIAVSAAAWREEIRAVATGRMKRWLAANEAEQFDYERFFYGDGAYLRPAAIPRARLKAFARRWWKQGATPPARATGRRARVMVDRLTLVAGPVQPGYAAAAERILAARSTVSLRRGATRGLQVPVPVGVRFFEGFYHPATIYLFEPDGASTLPGPGPYTYRITVLRPE